MGKYSPHDDILVTPEYDRLSSGSELRILPSVVDPQNILNPTQSENAISQCAPEDQERSLIEFPFGVTKKIQETQFTATRTDKKLDESRSVVPTYRPQALVSNNNPAGPAHAESQVDDNQTESESCLKEEPGTGSIQDVPSESASVDSPTVKVIGTPTSSRWERLFRAAAEKRKLREAEREEDLSQSAKRMTMR
mmetsp:Transcript_39226/g.75189  ORF Transcript_39226/g.75189 Transcript_39226/m.75189 type:complete len:194 (+) Transcript_39226:90-671(+)|eukprot:CAMPEP_0114253660 /NCGR_PEP_ID=MMETSP0058-20121206/16514_1 /TAXON_ID=36894 /ORGANISM="Pyramimonas parkeae, CCMP726" /LENGTH=193 /DNA_ID=CAMNT_0001367727 /DNA_START=64 /DNA_END=645 /DNA_ORIENTATION=+